MGEERRRLRVECLRVTWERDGEGSYTRCLSEGIVVADILCTDRDRERRLSRARLLFLVPSVIVSTSLSKEGAADN